VTFGLLSLDSDPDAMQRLLVFVTVSNDIGSRARRTWVHVSYEKEFVRAHYEGC